MNIGLSVTDRIDADVEALGQALSDHNDGVVGASNKRPLAILAHDQNRKLVAGLSGSTAWNWLYIQWLWVDTPSRGRGIAGNLLIKAEEEARSRDCIGSHIDTFSPRALRVYERHGYQKFGELPDFVSDRTRTFLVKRWGESARLTT